MFKLLCLFAVVAIVRVNSHSYGLGSCPTISPIPDLNMHRMLGVWYVIQKTSTASTCITYNFTKTPEPDEYDLEQVSQHFFLGLTPLKHEYRYKGHLTIPDHSIQSRMKVKFPLNPIGKADFTIFMTDYDSFAALYTCQGLGIGHRDSVTILSRTRTLDQMYVDKIRTKLSSSSINPYDLSIISQKNCPKNKDGDSGLNININDETISSKAAAGVVRKVGEKIGDGIEYIAGGAKRVYTHLANDNDGKLKDVEYIPGGARNVYGGNLEDRRERLQVDEDLSEWLP
ncbi:hypothetical protein RN001_010819 [Aquatica leii]|uniref:Lipocalin/cytosolic fatty-acid binding domain-containing protein n=1 Tax=Aquatica leii TaxID=1421715 RepID=A0AAN7QHR6_9COLE|nr:hypothetical protein RN001_010819 [Aquatica leii]